MLPSAMGTASAPRTVFLSRARWLACALPCRRFAVDLAAADARLGAAAGRYSFIVSDSHQLLLACLTNRNGHLVHQRPPGWIAAVVWGLNEKFAVTKNVGHVDLRAARTAGIAEEHDIKPIGGEG